MKLSPSYIRNNLPSFIFFVSFLIINLCLIAGRFHSYAGFSYYAKIAKSCGQCLNFTCSLTLVMVLRKSITWLRSSGFATILPLDQHIYYHKLFGYFILFYSLMHMAMHCVHFCKCSRNMILLISHLIADLSEIHGAPLTDYLFTVRENTWPREFTPVTGWVLMALLLVMVVSSLPFVRRTGNFEIFFYCHQLYIFFYVVLIIHAPNFWYWFLVPVVIYLIEGANRVWKSFGSGGYTYVVQGVLLPSRVVHLVIKRPANFDFSPGDWVFVQIPGIARTEWHPFTISSAPEMDEYIWLHIRAVGQWTHRVYDYFLEEEKKLRGSITRIRTPRLNPVLSFKFPPEIIRGISYPPSLSPVQDEEDDDENDKFNDISDDGKIRGTTTENTRPASIHLGSKTSLPIEGKAARSRRRPPPILRTVSSIETRTPVVAPFQRQGSVVFCLPKPLDCDDRGCRRKSIFSSQSISQADHVEDGQPELELNNLIHGGANESQLLGEMIELKTPLYLHLDGPYGSPSSHIFHTEHAILIAAGIGVTPFASILQSIMFRYTKAKHTCPSCSHSWSDPIPPNVMHLKKVDFVWINRKQTSFEWFVSLLSELEITQAMLGDDRFLDIYMYVTSARDKLDMKASVHLALDMMHHQEKKRELIAGLKSRTRPGRPDWNKLFQEMSDQNKGRTTVFFCGPPELGRVIQSHCLPFGFGFRKEIF